MVQTSAESPTTCRTSLERRLELHLGVPAVGEQPLTRAPEQENHRRSGEARAEITDHEEMEPQMSIEPNFDSGRAAGTAPETPRAAMRSPAKQQGARARVRARTQKAFGTRSSTRRLEPSRATGNALTANTSTTRPGRTARSVGTKRRTEHRKEREARAGGEVSRRCRRAGGGPEQASHHGRMRKSKDPRKTQDSRTSITL